jgi:hypothetical protein
MIFYLPIIISPLPGLPIIISPLPGRPKFKLNLYLVRSSAEVLAVETPYLVWYV